MHVSKPRSPPRIVHSGERFLVWTSKDVEVLRTHHRLVGALVGALPGRKRQAADLGLPLCLMFEEALLAAEEGLAEVVDGDAVQPEPGNGSEPNLSRGFHSISTACASWANLPLPRLSPSELRLAGKCQSVMHRCSRACLV